MYHRVKTMIGYQVTGLEGELGRVVDFFFEEKSFSIEYIAFTAHGETDSSQRYYVSTWDISQDHRDHEGQISVTANQSELVASAHPPQKPTTKTLHSVAALLGADVIMDAVDIGLVEDFLLDEDDSWVLDSMVLKKARAADPEPYVYNIHRLQKIERGRIYIADQDPFNFDTPANKWPFRRREEELEDEERRRSS